MKALTAIPLIFIFISSYSQEVVLDTLLYNNSENRIDYVILGDGYLASQLHIFREDAQQLTNELFNITPFKEYKNYFNVFSISIPSNEEGAANDPQNLIDNYFGSTFNVGGIERLLVPTRSDRIAEVLANNFPTYDQVFMLVNSPVYGGSGGRTATSSTHSLSSEIAIHEIGHSFARLADEYWAGERFAWETHNMTQEASPGQIKWKNWLGDEDIGIISHSGNSSWKKPHDNCKMQFLGSPFCAVCREQFIRAIHELTFNIDNYSPRTLANISDHIDFDISVLTPIPNTLKIDWILNDQKIGSNESSIRINSTDFNEGSNELIANVFDSTTYDRQTTYFVSSVIWNINATVTSSTSKTEERREQVVTSVGEVHENELVISVFPNPTSDNLTIRHVLQQPTEITLIMFSETGQIIKKVTRQNAVGEQVYDIDMSTYGQGVYFLKFQTTTFNQTVKVVKQK